MRFTNHRISIAQPRESIHLLLGQSLSSTCEHVCVLYLKKDDRKVLKLFVHISIRHDNLKPFVHISIRNENLSTQSVILKGRGYGPKDNGFKCCSVI